MTGTVTYVVDCASFQGSPDWLRVAATCGGGAEKVTEGTSYVNPRWAAAKPAMRAVARRGFVPLAYLFLDAVVPGGAQASYFARSAGDLTGFGIVVDGERAPNGNTTRQQACDATAELRKLYPGHPIGGYYPHWYTGGEDLSFCDWLFASSYVLGHGDPGLLYGQVPAAWWAPYGSKSPLLLQFTDAAAIAGISGLVDCSAFHGTPAQLAAHVLPAPPPAPVPAPAPHHGDHDMLIPLQPGAAPVTFPVWASSAAYREPSAYSSCSLVLTGEAGAAVKVTIYGYQGAPEVLTPAMTPGQPYVVVPAGGWPAAAEVAVQRLDTKQGLGASAVFRTW